MIPDAHLPVAAPALRPAAVPIAVPIAAPAVSKTSSSTTDSTTQYWSWDPLHKSHETILRGPEARTAQFHPNWSNGTAAVRGDLRLNHGKHYWEIRVEQRVFGTSMMFGIGTAKARTHADAFVNLVGEDDQGWGLSHKGLLWHGGVSRHFTKPFRENETTTIGLLFDWFQGTLSYFQDGACLGVAFSGLNRIEADLYPLVASTAAKTEMTLTTQRRHDAGLMERCRAALAARLTDERQLDALEMPRRIREFVREAMPSTYERPYRSGCCDRVHNLPAVSEARRGGPASPVVKKSAAVFAFDVVEEAPGFAAAPVIERGLFPSAVALRSTPTKKTTKRRDVFDDDEDDDKMEVVDLRLPRVRQRCLAESLSRQQEQLAQHRQPLQHQQPHYLNQRLEQFRHHQQHRNYPQLLCLG